MKCASVADAKGYNCNRFKINLPKEGTKVREVYDLFQGNKGVILNPPGSKRREAIYYLVNFYGLDIRNFGHRKWCLVGEWFGKTYIDYLAEKIKPAKVKK